MICALGVVASASAGLTGRPPFAALHRRSLNDQVDALLAEVRDDAPLSQALAAEAPDEKDAAILIEAAEAQDAILHEALAAGDVAPFRFGCVFTDLDAAAAGLADPQRGVLDAWANLAGTEEWRLDAVIPTPQAETPVESAPGAYLRAKQEARRTEAALTAARDALKGAVSSAIARASPRAVKAARPITDGWRFAVLTPRGAEAWLDEFEVLLDAVAGASQTPFAPQFALTGPSPAFSFALLETAA